jgi:hypothetical protein
MMNANDTTGTTATDSGAEIGGDAGYQGAEVTTMTTTETTTQATTPAAPKAAKAPKEKKSYPFLTKAQIADSIANDFGFAQTVITTLYDRQTAFEQESKSTLNKNRRGFMSSHAVNGSKLALKIRSGEELTDEDVVLVRTIAPRYTKQMADHFRAAAIEADPTLAVKAACFFTPQ